MCLRGWNEIKAQEQVMCLNRNSQEWFGGSVNNLSFLNYVVVGFNIVNSFKIWQWKSFLFLLPPCCAVGSFWSFPCERCSWLRVFAMQNRAWKVTLGYYQHCHVYIFIYTYKEYMKMVLWLKRTTNHWSVFLARSECAYANYSDKFPQI